MIFADLGVGESVFVDANILSTISALTRPSVRLATT